MLPAELTDHTVNRIIRDLESFDLRLDTWKIDALRFAVSQALIAAYQHGATDALLKVMELIQKRNTPKP